MDQFRSEAFKDSWRCPVGLLNGDLYLFSGFSVVDQKPHCFVARPVLRTEFLREYTMDGLVKRGWTMFWRSCVSTGETSKGFEDWLQEFLERVYSPEGAWHQIWKFEGAVECLEPGNEFRIRVDKDIEGISGEPVYTWELVRWSPFPDKFDKVYNQEIVDMVHSREE